MPSSRTLRLSAPAKSDLVRIAEHTRRQWGARQKTKYLNEIKGKLAALRETPKMGASRDDIAPGLRVLPVQSHLIFHRLTKTELLIVRVLHKSMDPQLHL